MTDLQVVSINGTAVRVSWSPIANSNEEIVYRVNYVSITMGAIRTLTICHPLTSVVIARLVPSAGDYRFFVSASVEVNNTLYIGPSALPEPDSIPIGLLYWIIGGVLGTVMIIIVIAGVCCCLM